MEDPWPLRHLVLRTPRLELRPDDDAGLLELADVALGGVHPPDRMPFAVPWTDADPRDVARGTLQYFWGKRAQLAPGSWQIGFLVRLDGRVVGVQDLLGRQFGATREVSTGSWMGLPHQGRGIGTEMRAAVLLFAFDHLGAERARSAAFLDSTASRRVSEKLGYRPDGSEWLAPRGEGAEQVRLLLRAGDLVRPAWTLRVEGVEACLPLLGAQPRSTPRANVSQDAGSPES